MSPEKLRLLNNLAYDSPCHFGISEIHGIGVFTSDDIPVGVNPLPIVNNRHNERIVLLSEEDLESLPEDVCRRVRDLFIKCNGHYPVYSLGLNGSMLSFYINHSEDPNMGIDYDFGIVGKARLFSNTAFAPFISLRDIKAGEELTWDYTSCEEADDIHGQFPFTKPDGILKKAWKKWAK